MRDLGEGVRGRSEGKDIEGLRGRDQVEYDTERHI